VSGTLCTLVKPQFECARDEVDEGGVVRDPAVHARTLRKVVACFDGPLAVQDMCVSPIHGAKGNREFFLLARMGIPPCEVDIDAVVQKAWQDA
jgi:23S rRNA (cytidine1920-2'-O)/16S rRNA (cytidine1409-2'-O)-methyltransferase